MIVHNIVQEIELENENRNEMKIENEVTSSEIN